MPEIQQTQPVQPKKKKKWPWVLLGIVVFIIVIAIASGGEEEQKEAERSTPEVAREAKEEKTTEETKPEEEAKPVSESPEAKKEEWGEIKSWEGTGAKKTETFDITSDQWRITWGNNGGQFGGGILQVYVYRPGDDLPVALAANTTEIGKDTSYVYEKGTFYLDINAANTNWTVKVEER